MSPPAERRGGGGGRGAATFLTALGCVISLRRVSQASTGASVGRHDPRMAADVDTGLSSAGFPHKTSRLLLKGVVWQSRINRGRRRRRRQTRLLFSLGRNHTKEDQGPESITTWYTCSPATTFDGKCVATQMCSLFLC